MASPPTLTTIVTPYTEPTYKYCENNRSCPITNHDEDDHLTLQTVDTHTAENYRDEDAEEHPQPVPPVTFYTDPLPVRANDYNRSRYTLREKRKIVQEAMEQPLTIRKVARRYKVCHSSILRWKKQMDKAIADESYTFQYSGAEGQRTRMHPGFESLIPKWVQTHLGRYFMFARQKGLTNTIRKLTNEYITLCPDALEEASLEALTQRVCRWVHRSAIVQRSVTHLAQNRDHIEKTINDWVQYINEQMRVHNIKPTHVANFDETNLDFGMEPRRTLDYRGVRSVKAMTTGSSQRCTAMLGCTLAGEYVTPFIIFKGKRNGIIHRRELADPVGYAETLEYSVQKNGWMDTDLMMEWIDRVWAPFVRCRRGPTMLLLDAFSAHLVSPVEKKLSEMGTLVEIIPRGYTSKLQVMDVGLNRPFKKKFAEMGEEFVQHCVEYQLPGTKILIHRKDVSNWIRYAWNDLNKDIVLNTWKHIGLLPLGGATNEAE